MACKGICTRYKNKRIGTKSWYGDGFKRCRECSIRINWDGIWCPCCGYRLALSPRDGAARQKAALTKVRY